GETLVAPEPPRVCLRARCPGGAEPGAPGDATLVGGADRDRGGAQVRAGGPAAAERSTGRAGVARAGSTPRGEASPIEREMMARNCFVVILSLAALQSPWVRREWQAALDLEDVAHMHTILPILAEACDIPLMLRGYKRIQPRDGASLGAE